ncbi:hypothetical protein K0M31_018905 [Melipona bicolor]|uniref:Uncharacterized protein n=1 Tax=Melipona bicolor TaxID=60889 RepID=A0AA40KS53_9HYME|nr:hypothetical protein K0M31_018905 [Melipona bicolor]
MVKKEDSRLLKGFVILMDMMKYQEMWYKASSSIFDLEILTSKIHLALVDQSLEKSTKIVEKIE